jgi:threonine aldolase
MSTQETVMFTTAEMAVRELDRRINDGFDVRLLWNSQTNRVFVTVEDQRDGVVFELTVDAAAALEAFQHPFAYSREYVTSTARSRPSPCPASCEERSTSS